MVGFLEKDLKEIWSGVVWAKFEMFMYGQTVASIPQLGIFYYVNDIQNFCLQSGVEFPSDILKAV